jgi:hypothetical protein
VAIDRIGYPYDFVWRNAKSYQ